MADTADKKASTGVRNWISDKKNQTLLILAAVFVVLYFIPFSSPRITRSISEAFFLREPMGCTLTDTDQHQHNRYLDEHPNDCRKGGAG